MKDLDFSPFYVSSVDIAHRAISMDDLGFPLQAKLAMRAEGNSPI
jgi:hypothetical protein